MKLWPLLFWPKPKARQHKHHNNYRNINLKLATRTFSTPNTTATITTTFVYIFAINALLLITTTWGLTATQQTTGNYEAVSVNADGEVVSALTGLTNSYAPPNYIRNYYQVETATAKPEQQQQQNQQQQHKNNIASAAINVGYQEEVGEAGRSFVGLQPNNYGNSIIARGTPVGAAKGGGEERFHAYDGGFMPTTFSAAGQHYASSLVGLQTATDKINALHQYATTAANKNHLQANSQPYGNVNNNNNKAADVDINKAQHSLFRRLSNYGGIDNIENRDADDGATAGAGSADDTSGTNLSIVDDNSGGKTVAGTNAEEFMQNYALAYADNAQQSALLQNFYNQQTPFTEAPQSMPEQTFTNYFPQSMAATAGYEVENQQKYYTLNNYQQTTKPQQQQHQHQFEQQPYMQYSKQQTKPYELQQQQTFNKLEVLTVTPAPLPAPATYYQTYIQHKNDNKEHHHQNRQVANENYHRWKQNQITANYPPKQSAKEKQQQQQEQLQEQQQQLQPYNQFHQYHVLQEPETAETSQSTRYKKSPKHKSKRHDNPDILHDQSYNYDTLLEQNDNTIEHVTDDISNVQIQQIERLQEQLQLQQQKFIELQHQLIDHDQQLQIQKHIANTPAAIIPPITQTVHHNPQSLQALAGSPFAKHTHVIRNIPIPQLRQVHVPYRENVTIEVADPIITPIRKPFAIQIPITKTVTVPQIQEVKIPIEKIRPFPVERPIPYIVERRVPYPVEKQVAQPVYYPVPIKVPILHTVIHKIHKPPQQQPSYNLPHTAYKKTHNYGHGHGYSRGHSHYY